MSSRSVETQRRATLSQGDIIPDFTLPNRSGEPVSRRSFYMRHNLVLAVLPDTVDAQWTTWTERLVSAIAEVPYHDVQVLIIVGASAEHEHLDRLADRSNTTILIDEDRQASERFGCDGTVGLLLVTDVFGEVFYAATGSPDDKAMDPAEIPEWVELVVCQC